MFIQLFKHWFCFYSKFFCVIWKITAIETILGPKMCALNDSYLMLRLQKTIHGARFLLSLYVGNAFRIYLKFSLALECSSNLITHNKFYQLYLFAGQWKVWNQKLSSWIKISTPWLQYDKYIDIMYLRPSWALPHIIEDKKFILHIDHCTPEKQKTLSSLFIFFI